jgi:uncharacterized protein YecE (DUF72 family)
MKEWLIGCSGFSYKHWKGGFYPQDVPAREWFEYYCQFFNTVELNVTFYRFPKLETLKGWYLRSPEDFMFTVKAPRLVTHYKKFLNAKRELTDFYTVVNKGLKEKLGTVLFQLPPNFAYSEENLERLLTAMNSKFSNVIEFRHETWWRNDVYRTLKEHNLTFCGISYPGLPDDVIKTAPVMYYRFHGVPHLYRSPYSLEKMEDIAERIKKFRGVQSVYIYFNNDIDVSAIHNARDFQKLTLTSKQLASLTRNLLAEHKSIEV